MEHSKRMMPYLIAAAVLAIVMLMFSGPGISVASLLFFVVVCPLMMFMMMRGVSANGSHEDHTGHGCEHPPTCKSDTTAGHR